MYNKIYKLKSKFLLSAISPMAVEGCGPPLSRHVGVDTIL